ncbi:MAG: biopolymer transporter ExbD [Bryobacteraceae bacterium]
MAISVSGGSRGAGKRNRGGMPLAEINIIPLVDVVLVMLIIFMLTAHVMEFGLDIEVPKVDQTKSTTEELPVISLNKTGEVYLNEKHVMLAGLGEEVRKRFPSATKVYVRADANTVWDPIAQVVNALGKAKLQVLMVTQPMEERKYR